ncbi:hypothetical protein D9M73_225630 [compost metagenome]
MFLRFDPEVVHTTTITALSGASEFIRFGSSTPYVVDSRLIAALKQASLLRVDRHLRIIECRNMSDELVQELQFIVDMRNRSLRQQAFFNLLEQQMYLSRLGRSGAKQALIYTALA